MKCLVVDWPTFGPRKTFVLRKTEIDVLLDLFSKNPRSHYWSLAFDLGSILVTDGYRFMLANDVTHEVDEDHPRLVLSTKLVKKTFTKSRLDHAWLITYTDEKVVVARVCMVNKAWDVTAVEPPISDAQPIDMVEHYPVDMVGKMAPTVPDIESLLDIIPEIGSGAPPTAANGLKFNTEFVASFGKIAKAGAKGTVTHLWPGQSESDPTCWVVTATAEAGHDTRWTYVMMPLTSTRQKRKTLGSSVPDATEKDTSPTE